MLCLCIAFIGVSHAQDPHGVSLDRFLALVERNNPELAAAQQQRAIAGAEALIARAYPNPEIDIGSGPWRSRLGASSGGASAISITQPIELPSVRAARAGAAAAGVDSADALAQSVRLVIGYQAR